MKKEKKLIKGLNPLLLGVIVLIFLVVGCATTQKIKVNSEPPGARVIIENKQMAITPAVIKIKRKEKDVSIHFEKEGYTPVEVNLNRSLDGLYIPKALAAAALASSTQLIKGGTSKGPVTAAGVGFVVGSTAGLIHGFGYGAAYKFSPSEINVDLIKK